MELDQINMRLPILSEHRETIIYWCNDADKFTLITALKKLCDFISIVTFEQVYAHIYFSHDLFCSYFLNILNN